MMKKLFLCTCMMAMLQAVPSVAGEARLLRFPTTNGTDVVFTYAGDLYRAPLKGGEAVRLTSHVGYEIFPRFSPDGQTIAFTGQYDGNTEVYTLNVKGGEPKRITYTSTNPRDDLGDRMGPNNMVLTWTPDGKQVVYRNRIGDGFTGLLWKVEKEGGLGSQIPLPEGGFCSYSPDGKQLAYNRVMREFRTWKYYKGGMADDIWIFDEGAGTVTNITSNEAQDICPMWIGNEIYFISDRDRTMNMFAYNTLTKQTTKVTHFDRYDVKFPSCHGNVIVFENGGYLYQLNAPTKEIGKISITLNADNLQARKVEKNVADKLTALSLSPDGARLALTARGEVFNVPVKEGVTRNITRTPGSNDRVADWSPNGQYIVYVADGTGETELMLYEPASDKTVQLTTGSDAYIRSSVWSPDSKFVLYGNRKNQLVLVEVPSGKKQVLLTDGRGEITDYRFSPDGKWLTYTRSGDNQMSIVYLFNINSGKEYPVTERWYDSGSPIFSADGNYLFFSSARDLNPQYGWFEWNHIYTNSYGLYAVLLSADTPSPFLEKDSPVKLKEEKPAQDDKKKKQEVAKEPQPTSDNVKIDVDHLSKRILKLPLPAGSYGHFQVASDKVYYNRAGATYAYDMSEAKEEKVADAQLFLLTTEGKGLFVKSDGYYVSSVEQVNLGKAVDTDRLIAQIDYPQEWAQLFDEAWRAFRDGFYLENMHGVDWKSMKAKYAELLPYAKTRLDVNYLIGEMIGELCCGHCYVSAGEYERAPRVSMGLLGAQLESHKSGFFRISKIYEGAPYSSQLRSPLAEPGLKVAVGDYLVAVDGVPTNTTNNPYSLLTGKADVMTELSVNSKPTLEGARKIIIKPISNEYPLVQYAWVQRNIHLVDSLSGGKIGYIYIPDMGPDGLNEFARYFYPQIDKEALIVDDRANGGGNVSPMILERLCREVYRLTMRRGSNFIGTVPDATLTGPKVCLVNKYSASDGDLFPWGFRANGLGQLIGTRTWGGIVGISGSLPYMDGTDIRVPFFTSYDAKTGQWIVENHGVDPDILIDNDPVQEWNGNDQQLLKGIEVLLQQLKDRKPFPGVPAPRNFSK